MCLLATALLALWDQHWSQRTPMNVDSDSRTGRPDSSMSKESEMSSGVALAPAKLPHQSASELAELERAGLIVGTEVHDVKELQEDSLPDRV
jgi:hypothetical protein